MTFGIVPSDFSILLWAPLLAVLGALLAWLAVLIVLQRRRPRPRLRSTRPSPVAWTHYHFPQAHR